mmetsp:Transcript_11423/g.13538  ORF Transcript_11423/g.13538 Transcript_11423/m.13538 type:complete len:141 (+) Transcript_11423:127-549(+)|eukprot:CAMPEP_0197844538 /NCGR_PEP_ID=MMETSP1438-20131217/1522_1 /TAXON_ID=1461541 /ORGANISM="Pterosperma sp., Strain CCMP1384" /LENGTH=140 /DNA_ID=CAMNT_0043455371 /DNA_START=127 /DNA_END=549 /DNA_ORIENTATION=+
MAQLLTRSSLYASTDFERRSSKPVRAQRSTSLQISNSVHPKKTSKQAKLAATVGNALFLGASSSAMAIELPDLGARISLADITADPIKGVLILTPAIAYVAFNAVRGRAGGEEEAPAAPPPADSEATPVEAEVEDTDGSA